MGLTCFKSWKHDGTGHKGNRDVLASPGSYFFLSNSCGQGEEWLKSLNKGVWIPFTERFLDFRADRKLRMREVKRAVGRTGSYLSHSTYRKIKRVLSFKPRVFGQRLEETVLYERRYGVHLVPLVVVQCVSFIRERGLHEVGLFRQSGQATMVKELQEAFDAGERPSFDSTDVHTVASLLKLYLRQLPEPLVPYNKYQDFLSCGKKIGSDRTQGLVELRNLLHNLPVANFNLLHYICQFLNEVQSYSSSNKMSCHNLATVFGPNILRAKTEDPHSIIGGASVVQLLMLELIREHQSLFCEPHPSSHTLDGPHASPNVPRPPRLHPSPCSRQLSLPLITERRGRMGSVSSPRDNGSPSPQAQSSADHHSHSRIAATAESSKSFGQKRALGHRYTSSQPENCFYPLASTSYSAPQHLPDRASACHAGLSSFAPVCSHSPSTTLQRDDPPSDHSQARPGLLTWADTRLGQAEESTACIWSSSTAMGEGGESVVPGTASGGSSDANEDSTPSVYDNLDRVSLHERHLETAEGDEETEGQDVEVPTADSDSSWSSCEMLPLDHSSCHGNGTSPFLSATTSPRFSLNQGSEGGHDDDNYDEDDDDDNNVNKEEYDVIRPPNSPASCSMPSDAPLSTGSSEVFLPSGPPELQGSQPQSDSQDVNSLLAELQKQMARQKAEYQARINRLERCNESLQGQVAVLRVTLDQQKRWHSVAEIKIRNVERARADADRRNATLQREMEQFFRMFGEISGAGEKKGERSVQSF